MSTGDADKFLTVFSKQLVDDMILASNVIKQATKTTVDLMKKKKLLLGSINRTTVLWLLILFLKYCFYP